MIEDRGEGWQVCADLEGMAITSESSLMSDQFQVYYSDLVMLTFLFKGISIQLLRPMSILLSSADPHAICLLLFVYR